MKPRSPVPPAQFARRGFTLVELLIVIAIVAVISAIAYPAYTEQVAKSRRATAKSLLLEVAQWMERERTVSNRYDKRGDNTDITAAVLTARVDTLRRTDASSLAYNISFVGGVPAQNTYTLQAVPTGSMAADKCGTLTLTNTGRKGVTGNATGTTALSCWDR